MPECATDDRIRYGGNRDISALYNKGLDNNTHSLCTTRTTILRSDQLHICPQALLGLEKLLSKQDGFSTLKLKKNRQIRLKLKNFLADNFDKGTFYGHQF